MKSRWNEEDARRFLDLYSPAWGADLALRVYTSRLIGADPDLVLHGGGNTSVKTRRKDVLGEEVEAICVKGSGWDLATIEPPGLPALELAPLKRLRRLAALSDEQMVNELRTRLFDAASPTPSVETLLHAFLPQRFVDHTHADAILVLTNQRDGAAKVAEALGAGVVVLPWIMPGFPLAKAVADAFERSPRCEGIVLMKHGIFTFADSARAAYEKMVELVDRAERWIARTTAKKVVFRPVAADALPAARAAAAAVAPLVRGAVAIPTGDQDRPWRRLVCEWRATEEILSFAAAPEARLLAPAGPITPDHVIRTKPGYVTLPAIETREEALHAVAEFAERYRGYVELGRRTTGRQVRELDAHPRVVLVAGAGLFAFGLTKKDAVIAADIAEHTVRAKAQAHACGGYEELGPALFEMEYWSLEQAKLGKETPKLLAGQVALITGAAGAIGVGIAEQLVAAGANVVLADVDAARLEKALARVRSRSSLAAASVVLDVTREESVREGFAEACRLFGGIDIVVPNAGIAAVAGVDELSFAEWQRVQRVNLDGTFLVVREGARVMKRQGTGGSIVISASKNVFDPGARFGAYSASKAAAHQLGKVAALELAADGIRVNMINADAVFGDAEFPSGLWEQVGPDRMKSRGLDPAGLRAYYRDRNLLKLEVRAEHVGNAVVFFASCATPTTGATLPVDGGIPGAFPR